ncbi:hypothetical protein [Caulobacter soli]|uniref:hypothetical protein n=1 Tax=Caulobacter soli TaxID=2708539 RepID=UPI0013EB62C0|nr:hypothetical protein [Caulobacter soli]
MSQASTRDLSLTLQEIIDLLHAHGDTYVANGLVDKKRRLAKGDPTVISGLVAETTGGSGSLNDRILSIANGDRIAPGEETAVNAELRRLVDQLRSQALARAAA